MGLIRTSFCLVFLTLAFFKFEGSEGRYISNFPLQPFQKRFQLWNANDVIGDDQADEEMEEEIENEEFEPERIFYR
jgi:hypothetical protein